MCTRTARVKKVYIVFFGLVLFHHLSIEVVVLPSEASTTEAKNNIYLIRDWKGEVETIHPLFRGVVNRRWELEVLSEKMKISAVWNFPLFSTAHPIEIFE